MQKNLPHSALDRQNILNNPLALKAIQDYLGISGMLFEGEYRFTTKMVREYYEISTPTVERYISNYRDELEHNGFEVIKGRRLAAFKSLFGFLITTDEDEFSQTLIHECLSEKNQQNQGFKRLKALALFNFRAFLNIGMLLSESEKAKALRGAILDIVIDTINQKTGGSTKFINQRDSDFLHTFLKEPVYRKEFTQALNLYLEMGNYKYAFYTDKIYSVIFKEKASEYRAILKLEERENPRETMYATVLQVIASFEIGIADEIKEAFNQKGEKKLLPTELDALIEAFANKRHWRPQIEEARRKMASRDYTLRDVLHEPLQNYIEPLAKQDYEKFLGEKSQSLIEQIENNPELLAVFQRLKDR